MCIRVRGKEFQDGLGRDIMERRKRAEEEEYVLVNCHLFLWVTHKE